MDRRGVEVGPLWLPHLDIAAEYRIELVGLDRSVVAVGEARRDIVPFALSTLPEELAKVDTEESALGFARRNGLLAYTAKEPLAFIFHEARKARLVFVLLRALEDVVLEDAGEAVLEAVLEDVVGVDNLARMLESRGENVQPTWREDPQLGTVSAPAWAPPDEPTPEWAARCVIEDILNAPVGEPLKFVGEYVAGTRVNRGDFVPVAPGVVVSRYVMSVGAQFLVVQGASPLLAVIRWWFQEELRAGRRVRQCQWCHNFFFVYDGRQRYCRRPAGDPGPAAESLCAAAARGKRFRGRRAQPLAATPGVETTGEIVSRLLADPTRRTTALPDVEPERRPIRRIRLQEDPGIGPGSGK